LACSDERNSVAYIAPECFDFLHTTNLSSNTIAQRGTQVDESSLEIHTDTLCPETAISAESTFLLGAPSAGSKSAEKMSSPFVAVVAAAVSSALQKLNFVEIQ
jgi:hypothetical protein